MGRVFVIVLDYRVPLEQIDAALPEHQAWLDVQYAAGRFLASGRREPRVGGVILAGDQPREELLGALAQDPFARRALATHTVIEFHPSRLGAVLEGERLRAAMS